ncbi:2-(3-amino-3-carboxypropyl)histidine synthase subunit 2-like [Haliotis rubra]|uniref:2-(3-amino-3-carboxypropyl)histidine synthase subunit 2-like n=1 Tax=Haliotis rubra TaxID=36100 RepID=UPI001EE4FE32|nr:2-(3-amino-3-carboxypropyl)histidine synthase subunit 2-like [Haliotis rubra]XP_046566955.1 2-(3-amino-3-carboxypropyl)histidine synthase subunit 2-like [Haliotis rubra]
MTSAFFSPDVVNRKTDVDVQTDVKNDDVSRVYEIQRCTEWIKSGNFSRVAIQLPDNLLCDSARIVQELENSTAAKLFILGDTSYGSCCVDEIAAQHNAADCIIHFGRSCLSPTKRLPVLFIFGQRPVDQSDCVVKFQELFPDQESKVVFLYDTYYAYIVDDIFNELQKSHKSLVLSRLLTPNSESGSTQDKSRASVFTRCNRTLQLGDSETIDSYSVFYLGGESLALTNLMMNFNKCAFYTYDPESCIGRRETLNVNKALMKRYYMIERIKDASIVGIVAGTLGVANYLEVISRLKKLIKIAGKKSYTFVVGKLNVAKLANFMEIDVFVLVSCPENTLIESSEFYKPVVTPFEVEIALNSDREWTGDYITDFQEILPGATSYVEIPEDQDAETVADVSLISNQIRMMGSHDEAEGLATSTALVSRDQNMAVATVKAQSAGEFLGARTWQGLERNLGDTPVTKATEGRSGIAASYEDEPA